MKKGTLLIGTSGWNYRHWKGKFYPEGLPAKDEFTYYSERFATVELNNSFYRLPSPETFALWKKSAPEGFIFSVKAPRFITHMKKLKTDHDGLKEFLSNASNLKTKAGPFLFQLPPRWKINLERLEEFLHQLPQKYRYTFEFRDMSWYTENTYEILRQYNCAFCIYHLEHHLTPLEITADFIYVRLHGPGNKYQGSYNSTDLHTWASHCRNWLKKGLDVYVYFDNDQDGYAAANAKELQELLNQKVPVPL
jgi:uncharacterized protein YecE (DUF72 family)